VVSQRSSRRKILYDELLERHGTMVEGIVSQVSRRFPPGLFDSRDLIQEGVIALMMAADRFDPDRGVFDDYADVVIRGSVLRAVIKGQWGWRSDVDLDTVEAPLHDVRDLLLELSIPQRYVVVRSFGLDGSGSLTDDEMAVNLEIKAARVMTIRMEALALMRKIYCEEVQRD
jgi:DNA-directed RNA polymerase sigma subunit (sigma70/sigma32)